jgi:pectate lyase
VVGEIYMRTNGNFYVRPNKTIIGLGTNATLVGCLGLFGSIGSTIGCSNVIIRNLTIRNPDQFGEDDGITIKSGAHHVWVDHCTLHDAYDGMLDVTKESDFVTVSWCKFYYTSLNSHGDTVDLIGAADEDSTDLGKLHVTFHHNWWGALCRERIPSVRFGRVHVYDNYYNCVDNHYCARARLYSEVLVENNYFDNVYNPWEVATSSLGPNGRLRATGNITNNCTFSTTHYDPNLPNSGVVLIVPGDDVLSTGVNQLNPPPYTYPLDAALNVPTLVQTHAGAGRGPFAP